MNLIIKNIRRQPSVIRVFNPSPVPLSQKLFNWGGKQKNKLRITAPFKVMKIKKNKILYKYFVIRSRTQRGEKKEFFDFIDFFFFFFLILNFFHNFFFQNMLHKLPSKVPQVPSQSAGKFSSNSRKTETYVSDPPFFSMEANAANKWRVTRFKRCAQAESEMTPTHVTR